MEVTLPHRLNNSVVVVDDVLRDLGLAAVDLDAVVRDDRVRADALGVQAGEQRSLFRRVGVALLDVRDGNFAERMHLLEMALVDERLDVRLDVVDVAVDGPLALELFDLVNVPALV